MKKVNKYIFSIDWALAVMQRGLRVKRKHWPDDEFITLDLHTHTFIDEINNEHTMIFQDLNTKDWGKSPNKEINWVAEIVRTHNVENESLLKEQLELFKKDIIKKFRRFEYGPD